MLWLQLKGKTSVPMSVAPAFADSMHVAITSPRMADCHIITVCAAHCVYLPHGATQPPNNYTGADSF